MAVLLHFFFLCAFAWMLVEGLHLYSMVVKVFGSEGSKHFYYYAIGWGESTEHLWMNHIPIHTFVHEQMHRITLKLKTSGLFQSPQMTQFSVIREPERVNGGHPTSSISPETDQPNSL